MVKKVKAISLLSGGLDSILAVKVLMEQGIEVTGLTFVSPFFGSANGERAAAQLGIELIVRDISCEVMDLVRRPPHGYGKQLNPCIDCHALMIREAGILAREKGYDFIATGEVLGERPMSQNRQSLDTVARDSGCADILLRPLSAKLLPPTKPEKDGLVDREKLLAIEGRSRKPQMELARKFGIKKYMQPAGGCLLTDPAFCTRLSELMRSEPDFSIADVELLKLGRHFRLPSGAKVIVGRDKKDNDKITSACAQGDSLITSDIVPGPVVLLKRSQSSSDIEFAARVCASYSDHEGREIDMELYVNGGRTRIKANPSPREEFQDIKI